MGGGGHLPIPFRGENVLKSKRKMEKNVKCKEDRYKENGKEKGKSFSKWCIRGKIFSDGSGRVSVVQT
jgi:hypothetical protein